MPTKQREAHPLAGQAVILSSSNERINDQLFHVEDWWQNVSGKSWMDSIGNPAALIYAGRAMHFPLDNEVVYGKIGRFGYLVHVSELNDPSVQKAS